MCLNEMWHRRASDFEDRNVVHLGTHCRLNYVLTTVSVHQIRYGKEEPFFCALLEDAPIRRNGKRESERDRPNLG